MHLQGDGDGRTDGAGGSDATRVHIEVDDRDEPPSAPARPTVRATEKSSTSLDVSWTAPDNMGPPITGYTVEYRKGSEAFSDDGVSFTGTTTATISGTDPMQIRVPILLLPGSPQHLLRGAGAGDKRRALRLAGPGRQRARGGPTEPTTSRYSTKDLTPMTRIPSALTKVNGTLISPSRGGWMRTPGSGSDSSEGCSPMTQTTTG